MSTVSQKNVAIEIRRQEAKRRRRFLTLLGCMVVIATSIALMVPALSMTRGALMCEIPEHQHSDACYEQVLVCGLEEGEDHQHTDACYELQLACGLQEHAHSDACYEAPAKENDSSDQGAESGEGALEDVLAMRTPSASQGTVADANAIDPDPVKNADAIGAAAGATAGQDGTNSAAVGAMSDANAANGPDDSTVDEGVEVTSGMPAQDFEAGFRDVDGNIVMIVKVSAPEGAFPANTLMKIDGVPADDVREAVVAALNSELGDKLGQVAGSVSELDAPGTDGSYINRIDAVDITFFNPEGVQIQPAKKVEVRISAGEIRDMKNPVVVHVNEVADLVKLPDGSAMTHDGQPFKEAKEKYNDAELVKKVQLVNELEDNDSTGNENTLKFQAEKFSPYVIVELTDGTSGETVDSISSDSAAEGEEGEPVEDEGEKDDSAEGEAVEGGAAEGGPAEGAEGAGSGSVIESEPEFSMPAQSFYEEFPATQGVDALSIVVEAPEGALPEGATMVVKRVEDASVIGAAKEKAASGIGMLVRRAEAVAVDITFLDADGNEVEPAADVRVAISTKAIAKCDEVAVVHFDAERGAELVDSEHVGASAADAAGAVKDPADVTGVGAVAAAVAAASDAAVGTVAFDAARFSVYALVYTVDFEYSVNGETYRFSLPGGGFVSFTDLVEVLGVVSDTGSGEIEAETSTADGMLDVAASDAAKEFVANVESLEFSSPDLVWVGKADAKITVGALKEANGLECEYSANLTEGQIRGINGTVVDSGDWALISLRPFESEETLTVTMRNGDQFVVLVTDAQVCANVLTADGMTFRITVTYDESAGIPEGTILKADEIKPDTDEYLRYLGRTWSEINRAYSESKGKEKPNNDEPEVQNINVNMARFFDIKLMYQGKEIEPKAPVQVEITYTKGLLPLDKAQPGVVHFTKEGNVEILEEVKTDFEGGAAVSFCYEQDSFSVIGTYVQQETHDVETPPHVSTFTPVSTSVPMGRISSDGIGEKEDNVAVPPIVLRDSGGQEASSESDDSGLQKPIGDKTLVPNEDGTYTLTLSVKGHSQSVVQQRQRKANVLFVMDRSSSMITNTVSDDEQFWYYGTWNTTNTTFRGDIHPGTGYAFYGIINGEYVELNTDYEYYWGGQLQTGHWDWGQYHLRYLDGSTLVDYPVDNPIYVKSKTTRLYAEQEALDEVIDNLLSYNTAETPDTVEIALISFAYRRGNLNAWASETEHTSWVTGVGEDDDLSGLLSAVDSTRYASGTNWEEALQYAYEVISAKEGAEAGKPEEDYYVIFLTDGEPTNTANAANESAGNMDKMVSYNAARDEARNLAKYHFYNIFTYRNPSKENDIYSVYLTNYAYEQGTDPNGDRNNDYVKEYYSDAQTIDALKDKLSNIIQTIRDIIGHADVSVTDTLTTDAMTTTIVEGQTNGYEYTVKDSSGNVLYTVAATGDTGNPTVTFNVPGSSTKTYAAQPTPTDGGTLYSITTVEGVEYRMALADIDDETGKLTWDLAPIGILMDNCEYSVSFVVWPDQEAYNYVAGLNNKLPGFEWKTTLDTYEDLTDTKGYEIGGVESFPSIVKYADGTFAVLTNKDQTLHYSVVEMQTVNGELSGDPTTHGPYSEELPLPKPMELTATETSLEKAWSIDRSPSTLAAMLYDEEGNPTELHIDYDIKVNGEEEPYTTLRLGWDDAEGKYMWDTNSIRNVTLTGTNGSSVTVPVGTRWTKDFAIATGLMLSEERMDALHMDKNAYDCYSYGSTKYYILETGNDYTIEERIPEDASRTAYEFDIEAPVYHPMLVDGRLKSVTFNRNDSNEIISIKEISKEDWMLSLKIENVLRGYIRLEKRVVDKDGKTPLDDYESEFKYRIELENTANPGPFTVEGSHIPWYGINGLYYHSFDENGRYHYYQAETNSPDNKAHAFILTTESGENCPAECVDPDALFDEDVPGPTLVKYVEGGVEKQIKLYGNQLEHRNDNFVWAELEIRQGQLLYIANVPTRSTYKIVETNPEGYDVVSINREVRNGDIVESGSTLKKTDTVTGRIVADRDNHIIYTNKPHSVDLTLKKTDENGKPLPGAVFNLYKKDGDSWPADSVATVPGEGEKDLATYEFINLEDGSYKLTETAPTGYLAAGDVFFTVADGVLTIDGTLPTGVTMDEDELLLTVQNAPRTDSLTVRKQWLDVNGNPRNPGADDIAITLKRTVDTPAAKTLTIEINANINGQGQVRRTQMIAIENSAYRISWPDNGEFQWVANRLAHTNISGVSIQDGISSHGNPSQHGNNSSAIWNISGLQNVTEDITITFTYQSGYNGDGFLNNNANFYNALSNAAINFEATGTVLSTGTGNPQEDDWSQIIHLNDDNNWSSALTDLPAQDGSGNGYHYYIVEEELDGYAVTYSDNNAGGATSGVLAAYNQRTSEDVTVSVRKVWEDGTNEDGSTTKHQPSLDVTLSNGQTVTLDAGNQWQATISGLPKYDHGGEEIEYTWTEASLSNGYYQSDSKVVVYDGEVITTLTNSYSEHYMPEMEIDGVKIWDDDGGGSRPESITVNLYKDGVLHKTATVTAPAVGAEDPDRWNFRFTNLPIFVTDENGNATGTLAVYTVQEVLPAGHASDYETVIQQTAATYTAGTAEAHAVSGNTARNQPVSEGADLGFIVAKQRDDYIVWTSRPLMEGELEKIKTAAKNASSHFSRILDAPESRLTTIFGVPKTVSASHQEAATAYMKGGDVWVKFERNGAHPNIVYGSIPYTYTQIGGEGGVTITNTRKTTTVSGTKTWVDGGREHTNSDEIKLKLYRRPATSESEADWEEVVESPATIGMTLTWEDAAYTFSNLPRYVDIATDPLVEYEYRVEEASVTVTDENQQPVHYLSEASGNDFTNTELTRIDAVKTWKQGDDVINGTIADASATFELQRKSGENWEKVEQSGLTNPVVMTAGDTPNEDAWKAAWDNLPKYTLIGGASVPIEYRVIETEAWLYGGVAAGSSSGSGNGRILFNVKPDGAVAAAGVPLNIDNALPDTSLSVTKQWRDGTAENADRMFDEAKAINFTLYQKIGESAGTVYDAYGTNGRGTVAYTPKEGETAAFWSTAEVDHLPKYVYDSESGTWIEASYYVVEDDPGGVAIAYQLDEGEAVDAGEEALAEDGSTITIINTDILADLTILKVDSNGMTTPLKGATFTIQQFDETKPALSLLGDPVTATTTGENVGETGADGIARFTGLKAGYYVVKETKLPEGYVQSGDGSFYVKVDNGAVTLIEKNTDGAWEESAGADKLVFAAATETDPATITVGNDAGAALPHTGGPGIGLLYILGSILLLGAGALLRRSRRMARRQPSWSMLPSITSFKSASCPSPSGGPPANREDASSMPAKRSSCGHS